jgi:hypothetical protein
MACNKSFSGWTPESEGRKKPQLEEWEAYEHIGFHLHLSSPNEVAARVHADIFYNELLGLPYEGTGAEARHFISCPPLRPDEELCPYDKTSYQAIPGYVTGKGCPVCKSIADYHLPVPKKESETT